MSWEWVKRNATNCRLEMPGREEGRYFWLTSAELTSTWVCRSGGVPLRVVRARVVFSRDWKGFLSLAMKQDYQGTFYRKKMLGWATMRPEMITQILWPPVPPRTPPNPQITKVTQKWLKSDLRPSGRSDSKTTTATHICKKKQKGSAFACFPALAKQNYKLPTTRRTKTNRLVQGLLSSSRVLFPNFPF